MKYLLCLGLLFINAYTLCQETIVVIGGAGYIGSHTAHLLHQHGYNVVIIDSFNHNQRFNHSWATVYQQDFADQALLDTIFTTYNVAAVMHFAALIEVGESVKNPIAFYENNVGKTITLLHAMLKHNVKRFIFSSTCAVYGIPQWLPLTEEHPKNPINPYGRTKLMIETMLQDLQASNGLEFIILRYFNAAGAYPQEDLGEQHNPESHLIPLLISAALHRTPFYIFGNDYDTPDGTAIRDYLNVRDIADAHVKALMYLTETKNSEIINLGTGTGFSVQRMVNTVEQITKQKIDAHWAPRRAGDPAALVADPSKAQKLLGWQPQFSAIEEIVETAYMFVRTHSTRLHSLQPSPRLRRAGRANG